MSLNAPVASDGGLVADRAPTDRPLVRHRGPVAGIAVTAFALFIAFGLFVHGARTPTHFDLTIGNWLQSHFHPHRLRARSISGLGDALPVAALAGLTALACAALRHWRGVALALTAPLVAAPIAEYLLKPGFDRRFVFRGASWLLYPSGHATGVFTVMFTIALITASFYARPLRSPIALLVALVCVAVGVLVSVCLVIAGFHLITDTIGAAGYSLAAVLGAALAVDAVATSVGRRQPVTTGPVSTTSNADPGTDFS